MTLTEFLLARIAEDEDRAEYVEREWANAKMGLYSNDSYVNAEQTWRDIGRTGFLPNRVRAECEAKRRLVGEHYDYWAEDNARALEPEDIQPSFCACCNDGEKYYNTGRWPCTSLRSLALPYADHPDYQQEWAI